MIYLSNIAPNLQVEPRSTSLMGGGATKGPNKENIGGSGGGAVRRSRLDGGG